MLINIPFTYRATVLRSGRKNPSTDDFIGLTEINIPEFSSKETTEVISWERKPVSIRASDTADLTADLGRNYVRYLNGSYYYPVASNRQVHTARVPVTLLRPLEPLSEDEFHEVRVELGYLNSLPRHEYTDAHRLLKQYLMTSMGTMEATSPAVSKILASDIDERRNSVLLEAQSRVAIDGNLWKRVKTPVLALNTSGHSRYLDLHVDKTVYGTAINPSAKLYVGSPAATMLFPVDALEQALSVASEHALKPDWEIPDYRVEKPDLARFDRRADTAARTAEFIVDRHSDLIGGMNSDAIARWLDIRDKVAEYRRSGNSATLSGLMEENIPEFLSTTGTLAGDEVWAEAHECLEIHNRLSPADEPAMFASSSLTPSR